MWFDQELSVYEQNGNKWYIDNKWATDSTATTPNSTKSRKSNQLWVVTWVVWNSANYSASSAVVPKAAMSKSAPPFLGPRAVEEEKKAITLV